ncbi:MAG TPA: metal ABC transporter permease [Trebonia sp.]|jgi:zinc/manganese transport system permease protein|nr:metal ABC transporter permease [Trebonia sp.]
MFSGLMMNTWIAASVVAVVAGMTGFFAVLRGSTFAAHAIPNGAFAGAAGAGLLGINVLWGLAVFAVGGALGIGALGRKARHDVVTALTLVLMLGLGALFVSVSSQYAEETYSLLFGEVFGVSKGEVLPIAVLGAAAAAAIGLAFRPLMLTSALPEVADAGGVSTRRTEVYFLVVMALATSMTVPVVGALLMFSLMIGPAAAARAVTARPGVAMALSVAIALATVWLSIALSYRTNWPLGFFVGVAGAVFYLAAHVRGLSPAEPPGTVRRHRDMKRIAAVALLVLAAAGCGGAGGGAPPEPAPTAQAGFAGYEWSVVAIGHDGKRTPIPARYSVYLQFAPDGRFGANDPVNYHFGSYRRTGDGFTIGDIASSLVGYAGADPVTLLAIGAISAFGKGAHATATVAGDRLTVTAGGYTLTCRRDGAQADFPPPTPT